MAARSHAFEEVGDVAAERAVALGLQSDFVELPRGELDAGLWTTVWSSRWSFADNSVALGGRALEWAVRHMLRRRDGLGSGLFVPGGQLAVVPGALSWT